MTKMPSKKKSTAKARKAVKAGHKSSARPKAAGY